MSEDMKKCPNCPSLYGYPLGNGLFACPECGSEWNPEEESTEGVSGGSGHRQGFKWECSGKSFTF